MHRLDVSVTGLERASGAHYTPTWMEVVVSVGLVAIGFAAFALAVRFLPVFPARARPVRRGAGASRTRPRYGRRAAARAGIGSVTP